MSYRSLRKVLLLLFVVHIFSSLYSASAQSSESPVIYNLAWHSSGLLAVVSADTSSRLWVTGNDGVRRDISLPKLPPCEDCLETDGSIAWKPTESPILGYLSGGRVYFIDGNTLAELSHFELRLPLSLIGYWASEIRWNADGTRIALR